MFLFLFSSKPFRSRFLSAARDLRAPIGVTPQKL
jgi:hypothetical protein